MSDVDEKRRQKPLRLMMPCSRGVLAAALLVPFARLASAGWVELSPTTPGTGGTTLELARVSDGTPVSIEHVIAAQPGSSLVVLGTYPADFNMIEYAQKVKHFLPHLKQKGVTKTVVVINGEPKAGSRFAELLAMPAELELLADPTGECGKRMGVSRGWLPDAGLSPYVKLFGMLIGVGPPKTLPAILTGYVGNPKGDNGWIQAPTPPERPRLWVRDHCASWAGGG